MITIDYSRLGIQSGDRILDMGCGSGRHVSAACEWPGARVVGADISFDDLGAAKEHITVHEQFGGQYKGKWSLCSASILNLPFYDHSFNHVICSEVMEHIHDDKQAARELNRVLKPGGSLTVSVPRYFPERICWTLSESYCNTEGGHVRIYRKSQISGIFQSLGLSLCHRHFAHSLHSPYWWLKCMAGPDNDKSAPVAAYHRFLTWDMMEKPWITRTTERLLNPLMGKSLVLYFKKPA